MAAPPPPEWVLLSRSPLADVSNLAEGISFQFDTPPRITQLVVGPRSLLGSGSCVLAADPSGIILFSCSDGGGADSTATTPYYLLWDAVFKSSLRIPVPGLDTTQATSAPGLAVVPDGVGYGCETVVAELVLPFSDSDGAATLRCYCVPRETPQWVSKTLSLPPTKFRWHNDHVLSYQGRLWWVDLLQGLLTCNPFGDKPELQLVRLPSCYLMANDSTNEQSYRKDLSNDRCISFSRGKLQLMVMTRRTSIPVIKIWTLDNLFTGKWTMDYEVPFSQIWNDSSYQRTCLPMKRPMLALAHPRKPHLVYFLIIEHQDQHQQHHFAVDLETKMVVEMGSMGRGEPSSSLVAWELPRSMRTSGPASREDSNFDTVLRSFCGAYAHELANTEIQMLTKLALQFLNRNENNEEKKLKVSQHISLSMFFEETILMKEMKYAHMNFYAQAGSANVLVFAEFYTDDVYNLEVCDSWTLSCCKVLSRNCHGGLRERSKGIKKRKKSLYCYGCEDDVLHPMSGFRGGHGGAMM